MLGEMIVLEEMGIRRVGMVGASPGTRSSHERPLVVGQVVAAANFGDCSWSDWERVERIGNEVRRAVVMVVGNGSFQLCWIHVLCLVRGICGLLRVNLFPPSLIDLVASYLFLLVYRGLISCLPSLVVVGMKFVEVVGRLWVVDALAVVMR